MPIIRGYAACMAVYAEAARRKWVLPCFCTENLTTTEAILSAAEEYAVRHGADHLPVTVAITVQYPSRPQADYYTHTRRWDVGLKLFLADLEVLTARGGPFPHVDALLHLDHVQHDVDRALLDWDLSAFSSIMYDASTLPFDQNIAATHDFVRRAGGGIVIEGACDEIVDATGATGATGAERSELTTPEHAARFMAETGVDMMVANLGTEHRASGQELKYHGEVARRIREKIGGRIVLHGCSSVQSDQVAHLFSDGVCKVNLWTALERDSSPILFERLVEHASKASSPATVRKLIGEGYLTERCDTGEKPSLEYFTATARQAIIFEHMRRMVMDYLELWYR